MKTTGSDKTQKIPLRKQIFVLSLFVPMKWTFCTDSSGDLFNFTPPEYMDMKFYHCIKQRSKAQPCVTAQECIFSENWTDIFISKMSPKTASLPQTWANVDIKVSIWNHIYQWTDMLLSDSWEH